MSCEMSAESNLIYRIVSKKKVSEAVGFLYGSKNKTKFKRKAASFRTDEEERQ